MIILVRSHIVSAKWTFYGINCWAFQLIEKGHSCCGFFRFLVSESGEIVYKEWADLGHNEGEQTRVLRLTRHIAAIHKDVLPPAMTMEITENLKISLLGELVTKLFCSKNGWMKNLAGSFPSSIKVTTGQRTPIVSINDTIRIKHRNDFEDKILPQIFSFNRIWVYKKIEGSFHHPRAHRFTWMYSSCQNYTLSFWHVLRILLGRYC